MGLVPEYLDQSQIALEAVARDFRPQLLEAWGNIEPDLKADNSPVTRLDLEIETAIKDVLRPVGQSVGFEGEEHGKEGSESRFWLIDPIDGTEQLVRGLPGFRIMATLIDEDEPQYAFVYDVLKDELYTARNGEGAFCNGQELHVSERPVQRAWLEFTANLALEKAVAILPAIRNLTRGVRMTGDFTHTLRGRLDGHLYYEAAGSSWDWVPWALLIKEAGGKVANLGQDSYDYRNGNFLAANPIIFDDVMTAINTVLQTADKK